MKYRHPEITKQNVHRYTFLMALGLAAVLFLPFIIWDRGYFFFYGDFNLQQIPFYQLVHDAIRSGEVFWSWKTDLGANFIGSYSFYNLFSPFFWLTLPFPASFLPRMMGPLLVLKTACAAYTSSLYLDRFTKNPVWTVVGGLLYAFSGWATYDIFFNHFHEPLVFFPLMLVGLEELMEKGKSGKFALAVFVNAVVNYWFFIGEVVFVILYFVVRSLSPGWHFRFKKFWKTLFEGALGCALAACVLLPSALAVTGNPRVGTTKLLNGWGLWGYYQQQKLPAILHSIFFPPDMPSLANFFPDANTKWASLSLYLPLFGAVCFIAFLAARRGHWLKRMIVTCFIVAAVPAFNAAFVLFNDSYYARWFYMPTLLLCLATILALEDWETISFRPGVLWSAAVVTLITLAVGFTPRMVDGQWKFGLYLYAEKFWINVVLAVLSLVLCALVLRLRKEVDDFPRMTLKVLSVMCLVFGATLMLEGRLTFPNNRWLPQQAFAGRGNITVPDSEGFARYDFYDAEGNLGMFWDVPNIQCFHSIVPPSIMEFYPLVGVKRDVSSKPEYEDVALRALLSVRWLFVPQSKELEQDPMTDFRFMDTQFEHDLYENVNYLPMGFTYDYYATRETFDFVPQEQRTRLMLRSLVLGDEDVQRYGSMLSELPDGELDELSLRYLRGDVDNRRATTGSFATTKRGFKGTITLPKENLVFYSVPYDKGWQATVNGQPVEIVKANIGFMAVPAAAGENQIVFTYTAPGLVLGLWISGGALMVLLGYWLIARKLAEETPLPLRRSAQPPFTAWELGEPSKYDFEQEAEGPTQTPDEPTNDER